MSEGYVYVLFNSAFPPGQFKIGKTTKRPEVRAREISAATGVPRPFEVAYEARVKNCDRAEQLIHQRLHSYRSSSNREFFELSLKRIIKVIEDVATEVGRIKDEDELENPVNLMEGKAENELLSGEINVVSPARRRRAQSKAGSGLPVTFEDHASYTDAPRREILDQLRQNIFGLDDRLREGETCTPAQRIVYKIPGDKIFLEIKVQRSAIVLHLIETGVPDPKGIASSIPESHGWGDLKKRIKILTSTDAENAMSFIERAYQSRAARD